jgi:hypothetical protein
MRSVFLTTDVTGFSERGRRQRMQWQYLLLNRSRQRGIGGEISASSTHHLMEMGKV